MLSFFKAKNSLANVIKLSYTTTKIVKRSHFLPVGFTKMATISYSQLDKGILSFCRNLPILLKI